jgi:hypothetical protein
MRSSQTAVEDCIGLALSCCETAQSDAGRNVAAWSNVRRFMAGILADRHARGSHRQFHHAAKPGTVTVAGHPSIDIPPETLNNILKQAGLK